MTDATPDEGRPALPCTHTQPHLSLSYTHTSLPLSLSLPLSVSLSAHITHTRTQTTHTRTDARARARTHTHTHTHTHRSRAQKYPQPRDVAHARDGRVTSPAGRRPAAGAGAEGRSRCYTWISSSVGQGPECLDSWCVWKILYDGISVCRMFWACRRMCVRLREGGRAPESG